MSLRNVDFNLLVPLRTLLEERSVSRAAERMRMSQPALSAALARLRRHFNDELLSRTGNSYELTPLGVQLLERSQSALRGMERVFTAQADFDPAQSTREFSIASSDYAVAIIGGALTDTIAEVAPKVRLRFSNMNGSVVDDFRDSSRDYDGVLVPHGYLGDQPHIDLFRDRWVCVVSTENSVVGERLTMQQLGELPWVYIFSGRTAYTPAAKQMELFGVDPRIEVTVSSFLVVPALLAGSDRIALIQERPARQMVAQGGIRILEAPFEIAPLTEAFWWNTVHDRDPEHAWFRSMLPLAAARAGLSEPASA